MIGGIIIGIVISLFGYAVYRSTRDKFYEEVAEIHRKQRCSMCRYYCVSDYSCSKHNIKVLRTTSCTDWTE